MLRRWMVVSVGIVAAAALVLAACGGGSKEEASVSSDSAGVQVVEAASDANAPFGQAEGSTNVEHQEGDEHAGDEHMADATHQEGDEHGEADHAEGGHDEGQEHGVPEEAMNLENPVPATEESIAAGAALYAQYCAVCHGAEGRGDGPGGVALNPKPANLHADHVQVLTDGGLFWFITNGAEGTGMPAWESVLSEEQRWQLVNYLRTFKEE